MSRNKEQNNKIKDERREQILRAALRIFAVKGLSATRVSDISVETGISQGLIYHYFRSKEELFTALVTQGIRNLNEAATGLEMSQMTAKEKITLAVEELLKGIETNDQASMYFFLISQAAMSESVPEEARQVIRGQNPVKYEVMQRIFKAGQSEGSVIDLDTSQMALVFWSLINGLAINKAIHPHTYTSPGRELILGMFLKQGT